MRRQFSRRNERKRTLGRVVIERAISIMLLGGGSIALGQTANSDNTVTIDLTQLTLSNTLPFDTRFSIIGTVPGSVDEVSVFMAPLDDTNTCDKLSALLDADKKPDKCGTELGSGADICHIRSGLGFSGSSNGGSFKKFSSMAPRLEHSTRYGLCINSRLTGEISDDEAVAVKTRLDTFFWELQESRDLDALTNNDLSVICREIEDSVIGTSRASVASDSPLADCLNNVPESDKSILFNRQLADVRERQLEALELQQQIDLNELELKSYLESIGDSFVSNKRQIEREIDGWTSIAAASRTELTSFLGDLSSPAHVKLSQGLDPSSSAEYAPFFYDAQSTLDKAGRFRNLYTSLEELVVLVPDGKENPYTPTFEANRAEAATLAERLWRINLRLADRLSKRSQAVVRLAKTATSKKFVNSNFIFLAGETYANFETESEKHVSPDVGFLYAFDTEEAHPYFGANFYYRPINRDVPLAQVEHDGWSWEHRVSFTLGLTSDSVEESGQREGLIGESGLVLGVGVRLTDVVRLNAGALVFRQLDSNPLNDETSIAASSYVGLSWDVNVKSLAEGFKGVFK